MRLPYVIVSEGLVDDEYVNQRCDTGFLRRLEGMLFSSLRTRPKKWLKYQASRRGNSQCSETCTAKRQIAAHLLRTRRYRAQPGLNDGHGHG